VKQVGWENQYRFDQEWFAAFSCYFSSLSLMGKVGKEVERQDERKERKGVARVCSDVSTEEYTPVVKAACQKRTKRSEGKGSWEARSRCGLRQLSDSDGGKWEKCRGAGI
jgi:hypothetical protein